MQATRLLCSLSVKIVTPEKASVLMIIPEFILQGNRSRLPIQTMQQAGTRPYNSRCCARLETQSAIRVIRIAKSSARWAVKLQFLLV